MSNQENNNPTFIFDDSRIFDITERYLAGEISDEELLKILSKR